MMSLAAQNQPNKPTWCDEALSKLADTTDLLTAFTKSYMYDRVPKEECHLTVDLHCGDAMSLWDRDTFNVYVRIKEANELCKVLNKDIAFSREALSLDNRNDVFVRAVDLRQNRTIVWSYETFKERLNVIKSYYQSLNLVAECPDSGMDEGFPLFMMDDAWDKDLSLISDITSICSESMLSYDSFGQTVPPSNTDTRAPDVSGLLQNLPPAPPTGSGNVFCDGIVDSLRAVRECVESSEHVSDRVVTTLTVHLLFLHRDVTLWSQQLTSPHFKMCSTTQDLIRTTQSIIQGIRSRTTTPSEELARFNTLVETLLYQCGETCCQTFLNQPAQSDTAVFTSHKKGDVDVTSDYNSSNSSMETDSGEGEVQYIKGRSRIMDGVRGYLVTLLDNTLESVTNTTDAVLEHQGCKAGGRAGNKIRNLHHSLTKHVDVLKLSVESKKREIEKILSIQDGSCSLNSILVELMAGSRNYFNKLYKISSWSRILNSALADKENTTVDTTYHAVRQLMETLGTLQHSPNTSSPVH